MKRNFNVIKIDGFKGLMMAAFVVCCLVAGFLSFPGWVCMHIWNFTAEYFPQMPQMTLLHGIMLWAIIALSFYALNKGNFSISFGSSRPMPANDERLKDILRKIQEENDAFLKKAQTFTDAEKTEESEDIDEKSLK